MAHTGYTMILFYSLMPEYGQCVLSDKRIRIHKLSNDVSFSLSFFLVNVMFTSVA